MADQEYRIEHDTMGEVRVPAEALWRAQTQRAVENFPISGRGLERSQIRALGLLKAAAARANDRLRDSVPRLGELPIGGTAVGSGLNAPEGFGGAVAAQLAETTGLPLTEARNHFEAQAAQDSVVETSGQLRTVAVSLFKIANDLR